MRPSNKKRSCKVMKKACSNSLMSFATPWMTTRRGGCLGACSVPRRVHGLQLLHAIVDPNPLCDISTPSRNALPAASQFIPTRSAGDETPNGDAPNFAGDYVREMQLAGHVRENLHCIIKKNGDGEGGRFFRPGNA